MIPEHRGDSVSIGHPVSIALPRAILEGDLGVPAQPRGLVLFAHGSGSSRHSPRNQFVAEKLQEHGIGTLLFDLLTASEDAMDRRTGQLRFNIQLLTKRLTAVTAWARRQPNLKGLSVGYFGASTGAAAALAAAAQQPGVVAAVVSRGGRPDLAGTALGAVDAPTLLIVGGHDGPVIDLNEQALEKLGCTDKKLIIVPGATHLFEEPGTLEEVAQLAARWFSHCFALRHQPQTARAAPSR
jgi:putative phosphoribosyl transferase